MRNLRYKSGVKAKDLIYLSTKYMNYHKVTAILNVSHVKYSLMDPKKLIVMDSLIKRLKKMLLAY